MLKSAQTALLIAYYFYLTQMAIIWYKMRENKRKAQGLAALGLQFFREADDEVDDAGVVFQIHCSAILGGNLLHRHQPHPLMGLLGRVPHVKDIVILLGEFTAGVGDFYNVSTAALENEQANPPLP